MTTTMIEEVEDQEMSHEDMVATLISTMEGRIQTYQLLSRLYREEVDEELLEQMHESLYPVASGNESVDKGNLLIATQLSNLWANTMVDLAVDYNRTFVGHGVDAHSAAYPFESVYTSEKRLLMQDARDEVRAIYRSEGLDKGEDWRVGEDHIAVELEFMEILAMRVIEALETDKEDEAWHVLMVQKNFLEDHLCSWVPMLIADIHKFAQSDLYRGLAYLTEGFLETDLTFLQDLLMEDGE